MSQKTTEEFLQAMKAGQFAGTITVDNDSVSAYEGAGDDAYLVCDFDGNGPRQVLIDLLGSMSINAEYP